MTELYIVMYSGDPGLESSPGDRFRKFLLQITSQADSSKMRLHIYQIKRPVIQENEYL